MARLSRRRWPKCFTPWYANRSSAAAPWKTDVQEKRIEPASDPAIRPDTPTLDSGAAVPLPALRRASDAHSSFVAVIPARYASTRLPGKPLLAETGWPLIRHV